MAKCFWAVALVGVAGLSVETSAQTFGSKAGARVTSPRGSTMPLVKLLGKPVDKVEWVETTFEEVVDWLRDLAGDDINIIVKWNQLNAEGIDRDSPVTLRLRHSNVAEVLDEVFDQLSEEGQVRYRGERNILRISTKADFDRKLEVVVYQISDILFDIPDLARGAPIVDMNAAARSGGSKGGGGSGRGVFRSVTSSSTELEEEEQEVEEHLAELTDMIRAVIAPESWALTGGAVGGGSGTIMRHGARSLVVRNTVEVHEELAGFFARGQ